MTNTLKDFSSILVVTEIVKIKVGNSSQILFRCLKNQLTKINWETLILLEYTQTLILSKYTTNILIRQ